MFRKCKCGCKAELPSVAKCKLIPDFIERLHKTKGYVSLECSTAHAAAKRLIAQAKHDKARLKAVRESHKTKGDYAKDAQVEFNKWIRLRDEGRNCISCDKPPKKKNAGHYRSVGAAPALRFEPLNVHLQCEHCNTYLSSNAIEYRINLIKKIGVDKVEWIEGPHEPKKYTVEDLKAIRAKYKLLIKALV